MRSHPCQVISRCVAALGCVLLLAAGPARAVDRGPVVVELFTSEGCSSCPPADKFLGELTGHDDVIALSFHVDYWDYIGWADTFATPQTTERQRAYGRALDQRYIYTPEMVVDGRAHSPWPAEVRRLIRMARERPRLAVRFRETGDDHYSVVIPAGKAKGDAAVWIAFYDDSHTISIPRGENGGRTLTYINVVRDLRRIGTWRGEALEIPVSMSAARGEGRGGCAVIVQQGAAGPILGAANMHFPN